MANFKRIIFGVVFVVGLLCMAGEGNFFWRLMVSAFCFSFCFLAWCNWQAVKDIFEE